MDLFIFIVLDSKSAQFGTPMFLPSEGVAIRSFSDEVNRSDPQNLVYSHPEDFHLYKAGKYDTLTGEFKTITPQSLVSAISCKVQKVQND